MSDYINPDIWMSMRQAAQLWNVHYETVRRNYGRIPPEERVIHKRCYYIWRKTQFRPQPKPGHPITTLRDMTRTKRVRDAFPFIPDLTLLSPRQREIWAAKIEAVYESPPED